MRVRGESLALAVLLGTVLEPSTLDMEIWRQLVPDGEGKVQTSLVRLKEFGLSSFEKLPHAVPSLSDIGVIFIKLFTVIENQVDIGYECLKILVLVAAELLADGGEVHGLLYDFLVAGNRLQVNGGEEGPGILVSLHLGEQDTAGCQVLGGVSGGVSGGFGFLGAGRAVLFWLAGRGRLLPFPLFGLFGPFFRSAARARGVVFRDLTGRRQLPVALDVRSI